MRCALVCGGKLWRLEALFLQLARAIHLSFPRRRESSVFRACLSFPRRRESSVLRACRRTLSKVAGSRLRGDDEA